MLKVNNREIDRLIANKITNYISLTTAWNQNDNMYGHLPHYSTNLNDAWEVVEQIGLWWGKGTWIIDNDLDDGNSIMWTFIKGKGEVYSAEAKTLPMAICLSALKTIGIEI